jgi:hypothetical protein
MSDASLYGGDSTVASVMAQSAVDFKKQKQDALLNVFVTTSEWRPYKSKNLSFTHNAKKWNRRVWSLITRAWRQGMTVIESL